MCGINGFNFKDKKVLKKMNELLKHRGPDAGGEFFDKDISLGHRRLSILDLRPEGNQPMHYRHQGKKFTIVFNGEVYNFQEIKEDLQKKGYRFQTKTDTEVILASYVEWGEECVNRFNGMWAFCIYDLQKNILFLSRDRLGQKPLYYFYDKKRLIFSSEIKPLLEHNIKKEIRKESVDLYLSLGFIPAPYSIYKGISKLEAGYNLLFDLKSKKLTKRKYYFPPKYNPSKDQSLLKKQIEVLLKNSIKLREISDVPLGAFLSGGLDSSLIVGEMDKINTFSIGFEGKYDESKYIKLVKNLLKTNHHHKYFNKEDFEEEIPNIFYFYDEPFADPSMFPTKDLCKFAREKLTVSLSGDGGDELFGGYPRYTKLARLLILKKVPKFLRKLIVGIFPGKIRDIINLSLSPIEDLYSNMRPNIYKPEIYKKITSQKMKECMDLANGNELEALILYDRYFQTLGDNFLCKVDRASMAHALEVRSPFLDYRFVELASRIPVKLKVNTKNTKILLREIASEKFPGEIYARGKAGFTPPLEKWILDEKHQFEINKIISVLSNEGIISTEWRDFFRRVVFKNNNVIHNNFKIRMFILGKWVDYWMK